MKPSMATYGWPGEESTRIVTVWLCVVRQLRRNSTACGTNVDRHRLTVVATRPSTMTCARPRVGPSGPTHLMEVPVNRIVALAPGVVDQATLPPA